MAAKRSERDQDAQDEVRPDSPSDPTNERTGGGGDVDEFVKLFAQHQRRVHAYIGALLPGRSDADDVMQDTSMALWKKWDQFDRARNFLPWACGVAYFEVLRHRRKYATRKVFLSEELMETIADEAIKRSETDEARSAALADCLLKLSPGDRQLIVHRYGAGVTTQKTAEDLGRPASTVYKAMARIRRGLLECVRRSLARENRTT
ncbi:MAG: sigma-70 family RNA polymerase sigma factor [Planctomycetota bacterium]